MFSEVMKGALSIAGGLVAQLSADFLLSQGEYAVTPNLTRLIPLLPVIFGGVEVIRALATADWPLLAEFAPPTLSYAAGLAIAKGIQRNNNQPPSDDQHQF